ncbi:DUF559 domain-containing protein [Acidithiobacillus ferridurans]|uniref:DUF559 domain-containing protein n=1 Tax=Acidithiobacillus ferridurans TaxID=1232575 RepID=A0A8X8K982_ACIFI|nr:DUF559 domain-containing protein [Acidithiobacillus ferridurans]MBU2715829.1 DUF559 domain-containing protein [Acidithiobacillus ferridurans]MBU2722826.1 DUF559 domain-containing protein [Acidithiobacillus ferridurans]MBU2727787.1 DUF559 domain-containing protein [Acidithiobacillus ferridurans]
MGRSSLVRYAQLPQTAQRQIRSEHPHLFKASRTSNASPHAEDFGHLLMRHIPHIQKGYRPLQGRKIAVDYALLGDFPIAIEIDGYRPHGLSLKGFQNDRQRQNLLVMAGWRVLRFTIRDIRNHADACVQLVLQASTTVNQPGKHMGATG